MIRLLLASALVAVSPLCAVAQAPEAAPETKVVKVFATLKSGEKIEMRQPDRIGDRLCGFVLPADAAADVEPKAGCAAIDDLASTRVTGVGAALAESVDGSLCVVLMPLCLAKVSAVQNRIAEKAIEKARAN